MSAKVSIIIPCYNAAQVLNKCLDAIVSSTYPDFEIICIDDCSKDTTLAIIESYSKVKAVRNQKNQGAAVSRNLGVAASTGDIILFIDSDVVIQADTIHKIVDSMQSRQADAVVGIYSAEHPFTNIASNYKNLHLRYTRLIMPEQVHIFDGSCVAIKKSVFEAVGGFDPNIRILAGEDWDLANRIHANGYYILLDKEIPFIHHKPYTLRSLFTTDTRKAFGVIKLFLRTRQRSKGLMQSKTAGSLPISMVVSLFLIALLIPASLVSIFSLPIALASVSAIAFTVLTCNWKYFNYFRKERGFPFSIASYGVFLIYNFALLFGFSFGVLDYFIMKHKY